MSSDDVDLFHRSRYTTTIGSYALDRHNLPTEDYVEESNDELQLFLSPAVRFQDLSQKYEPILAMCTSKAFLHSYCRD